MELLLREPEKLTKESPAKEIFQRVHQQPTHLCPVCMCVFVCVYLYLYLNRAISSLPTPIAGRLLSARVRLLP